MMLIRRRLIAPVWWMASMLLAIPSNGQPSPAPFLEGIEVDPAAALLPGHIFEIALILDQPPEAPVAVSLEASDP